MDDPRTDPSHSGDEREILTQFLDYHRTTLEMKCAGLSPDQLRARAVPPSTLSLLGLVRHMAEVEQSWFRIRLAGHDVAPLYYSDADPDGDFDNVDSADIDRDFAAFRAECEHSRTVAAAESLDQLERRPRHKDDPFSLRWILVHMIEEYSRHNGHADLLRQSIDGSVGE